MVFVVVSPPCMQAEIRMVGWERGRIAEVPKQRTTRGGLRKAPLCPSSLTEFGGFALPFGGPPIVLAHAVSIGDTLELADARADDARWDPVVLSHVLALSRCRAAAEVAGVVG